MTDQRLIKLQLGRSTQVQSIPARRIGPIERSEKRDGSGTLKIAVRIGADSDGDQQTEKFELGEVLDVRRAHDQVAMIGRRAAAKLGQQE